MHHCVRLPLHSLENSRTFQDLSLIFPGLSGTKPIIWDFPRTGNFTKKNPRLSKRRGNPVPRFATWLRCTILTSAAPSPRRCRPIPESWSPCPVEQRRRTSWSRPRQRPDDSRGHGSPCWLHRASTECAHVSPPAPASVPASVPASNKLSMSSYSHQSLHNLFTFIRLWLDSWVRITGKFLKIGVTVQGTDRNQHSHEWKPALGKTKHPAASGCSDMMQGKPSSNTALCLKTEGRL